MFFYFKYHWYVIKYIQFLFIYIKGNNFFLIQNTYSDIFIENISFIDSIVGGQAFDILNVNTLTLMRINCSISNTTDESRSLVYNFIGGCIRTRNIYQRKIENLRIFNSFSDTTSFGLKIIDETTFFSKLNSKYFDFQVF